jgi:putative transposase
LISDGARNFGETTRKDTPILAGHQIFHNYVRPHVGLNGWTPAERCGIKIEGEDKWKTIIENDTVNRLPKP